MEYNPFSTISLTAWSTSEQCCQHTITCLLEMGREIVTGSKQGLLLVWLRNDGRLKPKFALLNPGCGAVLALAACNKQFFVSSSVSGRLALWNMEQKLCVKRYSFPDGFSQLKISPSDSVLHNILFCSGRQAEVVLFDLNRFSIVCKLTASEFWASGWTHSLFAFTRPAEKEIDIIGLCDGGVLRLWSIRDVAPQSDVLECESKMTPYTDASSISPCPGIKRVMCITCSRMFAIIDGFDFGELAQVSLPASDSDTIVDCKFCGNERIISLRSSHLLTVYSIKVINLSSPENKKAELKVLTKIQVESPDLLSGTPVMECTADTIIVGSRFCNLKMFTIADTITEEASCDRWIANVRDSFKTVTDVSCCICLHCYFAIAVGFCNGKIQLMNLTAFLKFLLGIPPSEEDGKQVFLFGHTGRVSFMIHPHSHMKRYDRAYMLSSGTDFKICLWDVDHPHAPIHVFTAMTNTVRCMFTPPDGHYFLNIVCCETTNGSLSLIYLSDKKQVMLLRPDGSEMGHLIRLYWRTKENILIAQCSDTQVYVWQLETGKLERIGRGSRGSDIIQACTHCHYTDIASFIFPNPGGSVFNVHSVDIGIGTVHLVSIEINKLIDNNMDTCTVLGNVCNINPGVLSVLVLKALDVLPPALLISSSVHPKRDTSRRSLTTSFCLPDSSGDKSMTSVLRTIRLISEWSLNNTLGRDLSVVKSEQLLCSKILVLEWVDKSSLLSDASEYLMKVAATDQTDLSLLGKAVEILSKSFSSKELKDAIIQYEGSYLTFDVTSALPYQLFSLARVISLLICGTRLPDELLMNTAEALTKLLIGTKVATRLHEHLSLHCVVLFLIQTGYPFLYKMIPLEAVLGRILMMLVSTSSNLRNHQYVADLLISARSTFHTIALFDPVVFVSVISKQTYRAIAQSSMSNPWSMVFNKAKHEIADCLKLLYEKSFNNVRTATAELIQLCLLCGEQGQNASGELLTKLCSQDNVCLMIQLRQILVGTEQGNMILFDSIPQASCQQWHMFSKKVDSVSISPDGKLMAGYCQGEGKVVIWQITPSSSSLFATSSTPKELKAFPVSSEIAATKFVWVSNRTLVLLPENGEEMKFTV